MRSLIVSHADVGGGAALAAMSLHRALISSSVDSYVAVANRQTHDPRVFQIPSGNRVLDKVVNAATWRLGWEGISGTGSFDISRQSWFKSADVVNLHVLHGGHFNYLAVKPMAAAKPLVLTLHDMWHFTGHCVYSFDCERWKIGCGQCPYPDAHVGIQRDASAANVRRKQSMFVRPNVHLVAISSWIEGLLGESYLKELPVHRIPNGVDTELFSPRNKAFARVRLNLPADRLIVLACAASFSDRRKGMDLLLSAIDYLDAEVRASALLVIMGEVSDDSLDRLPIESRLLGYVSDDEVKADVYSAADLFVLPSRADNLPVVLQESIACGTPCVSFRVGGIPDLVRSELTGRLAEPENTKELAEHIQTLLHDTRRRERMSRSCREIAVNEYSLARQGQSYAKLFATILDQ